MLACIRTIRVSRNSWKKTDETKGEKDWWGTKSANQQPPEPILCFRCSAPYPFMGKHVSQSSAFTRKERRIHVSDRQILKEIPLAVALHPASCVYSVAKEAEARLLDAHHTRHHRTGVHACMYAHACCVCIYISVQTQHRQTYAIHRVGGRHRYRYAVQRSETTKQIQ